MLDDHLGKVDTYFLFSCQTIFTLHKSHLIHIHFCCVKVGVEELECNENDFTNADKLANPHKRAPKTCPKPSCKSVGFYNTKK